jgi:predicted cupin superfamily sugar epimerase
MTEITYQEIVRILNLTPHEEGGFYRQTFETEETTTLQDRDGERPLANSIFYLLTRESPIGYLHKNKSPIMHYFHQGDPLVYRLISPEGEYKEIILGSSLRKGHSLQLHVPKNYWKSCCLCPGGEYSLISEMVSPGWRPQDRTMASQDILQILTPETVEKIKPYLLADGRSIK